MNILILGATGSLGRVVTEELLEKTDANLTLYARSADRLPNRKRTKTVAASIDDSAALEENLVDQDLVFAALSGDLPKMAQEIVTAMKKVGKKRLIFVSSYGIYNEIVGSSFASVSPVL